MFAKAFSFIPYIGIIIEYLPEFIELAKFIHEKKKEWDHQTISNKIKNAIKKTHSENREDRLDGASDLEDTFDHFS